MNKLEYVNIEQLQDDVKTIVDCGGSETFLISITRKQLDALMKRLNVSHIHASSFPEADYSIVGPRNTRLKFKVKK